MSTQQRIADLEAQLALALRQRDFESERSGKRMDEIVELREQLVAPGDDDPKGNSASNLKWWEIELARKEQRIAELEAQLAAALRQRDCESERSGKRMDEIVELREQLSAAKNPRVMKRWGVDGVPAPGEMCWLLVVGIMHRESLSDNEIRQRRIAGCTIPGKITHWLESEPAPTLPETSRDIIAGNGD